VFVDDAWTRAGNMYLSIGHVNVVLGKRKTDEIAYASRLGRKPVESEGLIIDFLPPDDMRRVRARAIGEDIVVGMYMNNRAVEALARGRIDDAYWFAREAVLQSPGYLVAYNTLGAVYHKHGDLAQAEAVLRFVVARDPGHTQALANLVRVLADAGKNEESERLAAALAKMEPEPPFAFFNRWDGRRCARATCTPPRPRSRARSRAHPDYHEFHFWLAVAHVGLGRDCRGAQAPRHRRQEQHRRNDHELYAAKLDRLNGVH
jgi:tetratricopeptide (TPR) repeat protein